MVDFYDIIGIHVGQYTLDGFRAMKGGARGPGGWAPIWVQWVITMVIMGPSSRVIPFPTGLFFAYK